MDGRYGPRTQFMCSNCGRPLRNLQSACGCGGGAVPEYMDPTEQTSVLSKVKNKIGGLFGRRAG
jgi:hypothetical protein